MTIAERVARGEILEWEDDLTEEYRNLLTGMIQFTANSELMGAFTERQWLPKTPSYHRKLALTAKLQDEIGHAQMQYQLAESLGRDREAMLDALLSGKAGFGNAFHYPADDWLDIALIGWFVDGAAMQLQGSLLNCSYGPYARVMRRICREEEFHLRHGEHIVAEYATGSRAQQERIQEAVDRWWPRTVMFYGYSDARSEKSQRMIELGIKPKSNDQLRQDFFDAFVPKVRRYGLTIPDEDLTYDEAAGKWQYSEPHWDEFEEILQGEGPVSQERVAARREAFEETEWVRDALRAYHGRETGRFSNGTAVAGD